MMPDGAHALRYHGGNLSAARRMFPDAPQPWIDLSTGINRVPYPIGDLTAACWDRLPEPDEVAALEAAAGAAYGAGSAAGIVAAPGTQALIQWLPRLFPARRVGVLGFTYREHARGWEAAGAAVTSVTELADLAGFDVGVVVNPNNPDGRLCAPDALADSALALARRGGRLIVDEAFMDVMDRDCSLLRHRPAAGAIVLRSFGKAYGLAGLRLGFAAAPAEDAALLQQAIGPWAVSGPAIAIGRRALMDRDWLEASIGRLRDEAGRLDRLLRSVGFEILGSTPLFRLAARADAGVWFDRLCRAGILTRPFRDRPEWLRFGVPHAAGEWERLQTVLMAPIRGS